MYITFRRFAAFSSVVVVIALFTSVLPRVLNPTPPTPEERRRDKQWISSSPHWLDRQCCRWFSLCGLWHVKWDPPALPGTGIGHDDDDNHELRNIELRSLDEEEPRLLSVEEKAQAWKESEVRREGPNKGRKLKGIPDYVLNHAPLVHLYSQENFWPSDIAEFVRHMSPYTHKGEFNSSFPVSLNELHKFNSILDMVYLTSEVDVEDRPEWLHNREGEPAEFTEEGDEVPLRPNPNDGFVGDDTTWFDVDKDHPLHRISDPRKVSSPEHIDTRRPPHHVGEKRPPHDSRLRESRRKRNYEEVAGEQVPFTPRYKPDSSGYSKAPAVLVLVDKGSGVLDAFWFFFYSYNLGQTVFNIRFGNHVGDWEHCMVRFENGQPRSLFLSEHAGGQAYAWDALEKFYPHSDGPMRRPERPVIYSAVGSHAMYALPGEHPYVLPFGLLRDQTDKGPIWDPAKNYYGYHYDYIEDREEERQMDVLGAEAKRNETAYKSLIPADVNPGLATSWFHFEGPWGDETYGLGDARQWRLFGQYHYITGPFGPKFKFLDREKVCQTDRCRILHSLDLGRKGTWYS